VKRVIAGLLLALGCAVVAPRLVFADHHNEGAGAHKAAAAGAEHGEGPHLDPKKLGLQLFNFAVLVTILALVHHFAGKKALLARHEQFKAELASAAEARTAAAARLEKQEKRLAALEQEIGAITAGIKQEAEIEKERLISMAEERAKRIREETSFLLDQQVKEAEQQLRREAAILAVDIAERLVRASLDARDQQRLVDSFVGGVGDRPRGAA